MNPTEHNSASGRSADPGSALDWPRRVGATEEILTGLQRRFRRQRRVRAAMAVLAATAAVLAFTFWPAHHAPVGSKSVPDVIVIDKPLQQRLADGTVVDLRENTVLEPMFTADTRRVVMRSGKAYFKVVKNAARPFVVEAGAFSVRAVGTAFTVAYAPGGMEVLVSEGRVSVTESRPVPGKIAEAFVSAGESVRAVIASGVVPKLTVTAVSPAEMAERTAWRVPRLRFTDAPLSEAVALLNRHNQQQMVIADASLSNLQVSGVLQADNQAAFLDALRANFGVETHTRGDGEIVLYRRTAAIIH